MHCICAGTDNPEAVSSNPARISMKKPLLRRATGNYLVIPPDPWKKLKALSLYSAKYGIEYANYNLRGREREAISLKLFSLAESSSLRSASITLRNMLYVCAN